MNIALVGTGRMAAAIERLCAPDHRITSRFSSANPFTNLAFDGSELPDVVIDFSVPEAIAGHVATCCHLGLPLVVGTTGWQQEQAAIESIVSECNGTLLYAANFSIGVALIRDALRAILPSMYRIGGYDSRIHEVHHANKVDSPSGTAIDLAALIEEFESPATISSAIDPSVAESGVTRHPVPISSDRTADVSGRHTVTFDSLFDSITIEHSAKSRDGFAAGAIRAAEWLIGRRGIYSFEDVVAAPKPREADSSSRQDSISYMQSFGV